MLDAVNNPLGPLGLTSLTGSPAKEKPPAPSQAAFPSIERPTDPRPEIERRRGEIETTSSNIDVQIINNLTQQGEFQGQQAKQKAESEAQSLRELDASRKSLEKSLYESPSYKTIQEKSRELAEKSTFNPDQQNAQTLAAVFSIIGAAGFLLGGNNKNTAKSALAAMNGMAEGYAKGRDQYA
jgi:multidrug efflux pump subunit AcrB